MRAFTLNKEELLLRPECQIDTIQHNAVFFLLLYSPFQKKISIYDNYHWVRGLVYCIHNNWAGRGDNMLFLY